MGHTSPTADWPARRHCSWQYWMTWHLRSRLSTMWFHSRTRCLYWVFQMCTAKQRAAWQWHLSGVSQTLHILMSNFSTAGLLKTPLPLTPSPREENAGNEDFILLRFQVTGVVDIFCQNATKESREVVPNTQALSMFSENCDHICIISLKNNYVIVLTVDLMIMTWGSIFCSKAH